ncbi:bifunctional DNA-formamidopyrimidine glycosylase/DNA-(apurinic or apyrimidinic site) lyase [Gordonia sinesedis]
MPELPEVETVRRGLADHVVGRRIGSVQVLHPRAVRRHVGDAPDLTARLAGKRITAARRRGKYLWLDAADDADRVAVVIHLGMSGQMLVSRAGAPDHTHLRIRAVLDDDPGADGDPSTDGGPGAGDNSATRIGDAVGDELRFVDQRTFGGWHLDDFVDDPFGGAHTDLDSGADSGTGSERIPATVPESIAHIAPDPFEPGYDRDRVVARIRAKHTEIKRALLDQSLISGVGNIYADEALWRAKLHGTRLTDRLSRAKVAELLDAVEAVMSEALDAGGTSFDALYVNVNGQSGYFERSLNAYGREGLPCARCGRPMRREQFMNRSSFSCPRCQRRPAD